MTAVVRRLASARLAANTHTTIYTVPAGKVTVLRTATQSIDSGGESIAGLLLNSAGFVWDTKIVDPFTPNIHQLHTVLTAGESIGAAFNNADNFTLLQGVEMDVTDAPQAYRLSLTDITTLRTWSPPASRRFRIRELVITPHASSANVNIYIGGIGYIVRKRVEAYKPLVLSLDISVNAGENLGASADAGTFHAWFSGVLEDA